MGLSGGSTKQTYTPNPAQTQAASTLAAVYNGSAPNTQAVASQLGSIIPGSLATATSANTAAGAAANYDSDVLGGKYLSGNPFLSGQITTTDNSITDRVNGAFSAAGRTGSGANTYSLAKALAENENNLRYTDYNNQMQRMDTAAANAGSLSSSTLGSLLGLSSAATGLPLQQAAEYASGVGSLGLGGTTTQTTSPSLGSILAQIAGNAASAYATGGIK